MRRYPEYIETREELIGAVPQAWELVKMKHVAQIDNSGVWGEDQGILEFDVPVSTTAHLTMDGDWLIEKMPIRSFSKADHDYYSVKDGDIIVVKSSGSATNIITGKAGYIDNRSKSIVFSNFLMRVKANRDMYEPKLLYYFLTSSITKERIKRMVSATTYPNLKVEEYISNLIPMPSSKDEQVKIVTFLDRKTGQIDELVLVKERKIKLLQEQRTALINQAVTKGLDPNVEMKPSGVEWIGEIPRDWAIIKVKYLTNQIIDGTHYTPDYQDSGIPFLRVTDLHTQSIDLTKVKYITPELHQELTQRCKPEKGNLLLSKNGTIGITRVIDWDFEFSIFVSICLIKFRTEIYSPHFFSYLFQSQVIDQQLTESSKTSTVTNLHLDKIRELFVVTPPPSRQTQIIDFLDRKTAQIDELVSEEKRSMELLKEYRQSLISDAVTGKIDVQNEV